MRSTSGAIAILNLPTRKNHPVVMKLNIKMYTCYTGFLPLSYNVESLGLFGDYVTSRVLGRNPEECKINGSVLFSAQHKWQENQCRIT